MNRKGSSPVRWAAVGNTGHAVRWPPTRLNNPLDELRKRGQVVNEADFVHLSPVRFQHINRYGKFRFDVGDDVDPSGLRPLRS